MIDTMKGFITKNPFKNHLAMWTEQELRDTVSLSLGDFRRAWETTSSDCDVDEKFALQQFKQLEPALENVIDFLGMQVRWEGVREG